MEWKKSESNDRKGREANAEKGVKLKENECNKRERNGGEGRREVSMNVLLPNVI